MLIGKDNLLYRRGKKKSAVYLVHPSHNDKSHRGEIHIGCIMFPEHCVGKRVRVKIEFLED